MVLEKGIGAMGATANFGRPVSWTTIRSPSRGDGEPRGLEPAGTSRRMNRGGFASASMP